MWGAQVGRGHSQNEDSEWSVDTVECRRWVDCYCPARGTAGGLPGAQEMEALCWGFLCFIILCTEPSGLVHLYTIV